MAVHTVHTPGLFTQVEGISLLFFTVFVFIVWSCESVQECGGLPAEHKECKEVPLVRCRGRVQEGVTLVGPTI